MHDEIATTTDTRIFISLTLPFHKSFQSVAYKPCTDNFVCLNPVHLQYDQETPRTGGEPERNFNMSTKRKFKWELTATMIAYAQFRE